MFIVNLKRALPTLTYAENRIAAFLTNDFNSDEVLTSYDLANKAGVGQSTIIRFSQKLGYKSFKDMYEDLLKNDKEELDSSSIDTKEDTVQTNQKILNNYYATLKEVNDCNSIQDIDFVVDKLYKAKKVFCYGAQTSNAMARIFTNRLLEIGIEAYNFNDIFEARSILNTMGKNDVAFFVSNTGESKNTIRLAEFAKEKGLTVICITGIQDNTLKHISDLALCCTENIIYTNLKSVTNRCSQLFLIDSIYLNLWKKDPVKFNHNILETDEFTRPEFGGFQMIKEND